jgi:hypothetical protein
VQGTFLFVRDVVFDSARWRFDGSTGPISERTVSIGRPEELIDFDFGLDIHTHRGLVENEQFRPMIQPTFDELLYRRECLYRNGSLSVSGFREAAS